MKYCKERSPQLKEKIILSYKPLVEYIARKLAYNKNDIEDLVQVGTIALLKSLDRFQLSKDTDFSTFATPNIIGEIKHYFRDKSRLVKVPRKLQELYSKVKSTVREAQKDGISLTVTDIAKALGASEERILECMEAGQSSKVVSLDSPSFKSDIFNQYNVSGPTLLDYLGEEGKEDTFLNKETLEQAISKLDSRQRKIIYLRFYTGLSQTEIAQKMNLSQMHISRLLMYAIKNLRKAIESL